MSPFRQAQAAVQVTAQQVAGTTSQTRAAICRDRSLRAGRRRIVPRSDRDARAALRVRRRHDSRRRVGSTCRLRQYRRAAPRAKRGEAARDWRTARAWRQPWTTDPAAADRKPRPRLAGRRRGDRAGRVAHGNVRRAPLQSAGAHRSRSGDRSPHARLRAAVVRRHRSAVRARARTARDAAGARPRAQGRRPVATAAAAARLPHRRASRPVVRAHPLGRALRAEHGEGAADRCRVRSVGRRARQLAARRREQFDPAPLRR